MPDKNKTYLKDGDLDGWVKCTPEELIVGDTITWGGQVVSLEVTNILTSGRVCERIIQSGSAYHYGHSLADNLLRKPRSVSDKVEGNPKDAIGRSKPSLHAVPPIAFFHMGAALADGEKKYGPMNFRTEKVNASVYFDAALRHLMAWWDGEQKAEDSDVHHLGHVMSNMAILLDAESLGTLNDDRPANGNLPEYLKAHQKEKA